MRVRSAIHVHPEALRSPQGELGPTGPTGSALATRIRFGHAAAGPGTLVSDAACRSGEHAISGGFHIRGEGFAAITQRWSLPTPFEEDAVPTGWQAGISEGGSDTTITAYVICVPD